MIIFTNHSRWVSFWWFGIFGSSNRGTTKVTLYIAASYFDLKVSEYFRIYPGRYLDPLGVAHAPSRFSDPSTPPTYRVLYLAQDLDTAFVERVLRDDPVGPIEWIRIAENHLKQLNAVVAVTLQDLRLVDLADDANWRGIGLHGDVLRASDQTEGRLWSRALHDHSDQPDRILYQSRFTTRRCVAIYDRAATKLSAAFHGPLLRTKGIAQVLQHRRVELF